MKHIVILFVSILVFGCSSNDDNSNLTDIETTLISKGDLYGDGAEGIIEQNLVISDQAAWNGLMAQMNSVNNVSDSFTETDINFSQYKIIAVFDEVKGSGGHSLELNVTSNSETIIVNITDVSPEGNATTVITQPYHIVKITNSDLPILFE